MWNWISVGGGDGFQTQVDPTDPNIFYTESQNGNINRYDLNTGQTANIRPQVPNQGGGGAVVAVAAAAARRRCAAVAAASSRWRRGGAAAARRGWWRRSGLVAAQRAAAAAQGGGRGRGNVINTPPANVIAQWNWNSPIRLSPHNPARCSSAADSSSCRAIAAQTWVMSAEMGKGIDLNQRSILEQQYSLPSCGAAAVAAAARRIAASRASSRSTTATSQTNTARSPRSPSRRSCPGVYWAGTDDGNIQVSRDGGNTWTEVGKNIPNVNHEYYVSGIEASWYDAGHRVRLARRPPQRRHAAVRVQDHRLRPDVARRRGQSAGVGLRELDPPGSGEPEPALRADRVRVLHLAQRRRRVAQVPSEPAGRAHRRGARASARSRSDPRDARARHLDHGRHLRAAEPDAGADEPGRRCSSSRATPCSGRRIARTRPKCRATSGGKVKSRRKARRSPTTCATRRVTCASRSPTRRRARRCARASAPATPGLNRFQWAMSGRSGGGAAAVVAAAVAAAAEARPPAAERTGSDGSDSRARRPAVAAAAAGGGGGGGGGRRWWRRHRPRHLPRRAVSRRQGNRDADVRDSRRRLAQREVSGRLGDRLRAQVVSVTIWGRGPST